MADLCGVSKLQIQNSSIAANIQPNTQVQISKYSMTQTMKQKYYLLNNNLVNNIFVIFFTFVSGFK